jgi:hypothetical protein
MLKKIKNNIVRAWWWTWWWARWWTRWWARWRAWSRKNQKILLNFMFEAKSSVSSSFSEVDQKDILMF